MIFISFFARDTGYYAKDDLFLIILKLIKKYLVFLFIAINLAFVPSSF
jgi:hypothetical protein